MLIKYDPVVPADPRLVISHRYKVRGELTLPSFLVLMIRYSGCECPKDNHLSRTPRVDFSDFYLWARLIWEQGNTVEYV